MDEMKCIDDVLDLLTCVNNWKVNKYEWEEEGEMVNIVEANTTIMDSTSYPFQEMKVSLEFEDEQLKTFEIIRNRICGEYEVEGIRQEIKDKLYKKVFEKDEQNKSALLYTLYLNLKHDANMGEELKKEYVQQ